MICPECKKFVSPLDEYCQHCKKSLKNNPVKDYEKKADQIVKHAETRANNILENMRGKQRIEKSYEDNNLDHEVLMGKGLNKEAFIKIVEPQTLEELQLIQWQVSYLIEMIQTLLSNPNIIKNSEYRDKAKQTLLLFDGTKTEVNGSARKFKEEAEIKKYEGKYLYEVCINGGYVNFAYAISGTYVDDPTISSYDDNKLKEIVKTYKKNSGHFSIDDLIKTIPKNKGIAELGPDASMVIFSCLGHELGHVCYGHVSSSDSYEFRTSITNLEREHHADGFARMITDRSAFREQLWKGYVQYQIINAAMSFYPWQEEKLFSPKTHPQRIDRLKEAIGRFEDLAKKYGIDETWADNKVMMIHELLQK